VKLLTHISILNYHFLKRDLGFTISVYLMMKN